MNSQVKLANATVTPYKNDPKRGWIQLVQEENVVSNSLLRTSIRKQKRSCLVDGTIPELAEFVSDAKQGLSGKLVVIELTETEMKKIITNPENIQPKKAGKDGVDLVTAEGERIFRFTKYDPTGEEQDVLIQHSNVEEVRQQARAQREAMVDFDA